MILLRTIGMALVLALGQAVTAFAQPSTNYLQRLATLEGMVAALQTENAGQAALLQSQSASIASLQSALATLQAGLSNEINNRKSYADSVGTATLSSAKSYADGLAAPLADKLFHFTRVGNNVYITGANLNIRNGSGITYQSNPNGVGNLIVGYNELRSNGNDARTGSHNIVFGMQNNFTGTGGMIGGTNNAISGFFASVLAGTGNLASGNYALVSAGYNNKALGNWAFVGGGRDKVAGAELASLP